MAGKKAIVVCGPTASGKSELSDALAERMTEVHGGGVPVLVVDSMQVYREIPTITNQARGRPAELVGIVSVTEEWTVARHKEKAEEIIGEIDTPFVLDAGTGMYLNAIILDVPLAPKVEEQTRRAAQNITFGAPNPRRAARAKELELAGAAERGSIWEGDPRYDATILYLRPDREKLDAAIEKRAGRIASDGLEEAARIRAMAGVTSTVADSIGVRELVEHLAGKLTPQEAEEQIATRTRRLARRQMRWFDKLCRTLNGRATMKVVETTADLDLTNYMHDRMGA
jgi:tRNA dimethylallyltransferase